MQTQKVIQAIQRGPAKDKGSGRKKAEYPERKLRHLKQGATNEEYEALGMGGMLPLYNAVPEVCPKCGARLNEFTVCYPGSEQPGCLKCGTPFLLPVKRWYA